MCAREGEEGGDGRGAGRRRVMGLVEGRSRRSAFRQEGCVLGRRKGLAVRGGREKSHPLSIAPYTRDLRGSPLCSLYTLGSLYPPPPSPPVGYVAAVIGGVHGRSGMIHRSLAVDCRYLDCSSDTHPGWGDRDFSPLLKLGPTV